MIRFDTLTPNQKYVLRCIGILDTYDKLSQKSRIAWRALGKYARSFNPQRWVTLDDLYQVYRQHDPEPFPKTTFCRLVRILFPYVETAEGFVGGRKVRGLKWIDGPRGRWVGEVDRITKKPKQKPTPSDPVDDDMNELDDLFRD